MEHEKQKTLANLRDILVRMDVPSERAKVRDESDVHWLGRNVGINNPDHPEIEAVRGLLRKAGARMVM